ncbi:MAG: M56 family metallopeptidase, partial [Anaerovoracaceae bacterium]
MLEKLFVSILNMSLIGSYVIIFVLIARLLLKKAPKIFSYALWSIVLFRLICPFSFESTLSLMPMAKTPIPQDIIYSTLPQINTGINIIDNSINPILPAPNMGDSVNPLQIWIFIGTIIWVLGMLAMLIYSVISFAKLRKRLIGSVQMKDNIYLADHISSPFVMGIIKPKIYLPSSLSDSEKDFIIAHEMCHIKRFDHITRILGFASLTIHWFNPLVWASFILSGKDMELSCDEAVMKKMNVDIRAEYSQSLLRFATGKKMFHATPLAFGEGDTKGRIKNVLNYKKPAFWVIVVSAIAIIAIGVGLMTNSSNKPIISPYVQEYIPGQG